MNTNNKQLHRKIMRRVYYHFALRIARHPITTQVALFVLALAMFAKLVHVSRVMDGLLSTALGNVPQYMTATVSHAAKSGEVLTLLSVGVMVFVALSLPLQVWRQYTLKLHHQRIAV